MRILTVLIAFLLATSASAQSADIEHELLKLENVWNQAHLTGDADALDRLWANDLEVDAPRMTPMSKSQALAFARSGRMHFERYETSELKVRSYGKTAVVTGRLVRSRTMEGKQTTDDWRFTKVYARQKGQWRVVSFQASEGPPRP